MTIDYEALYPSFRFDRPSSGVLRMTFDAPGLNSVSPDAHREIAEVWSTIDKDFETRVAILQGAGKGFSSGGSFELLDEIINDYATRTRVMREANDLVWNVSIVPSRSCQQCTDPQSAQGWSRECWPMCPSLDAPLESSTGTPA